MIHLCLSVLVDMAFEENKLTTYIIGITDFPMGGDVKSIPY